jgi:uncharacterized protein YoxC
MIIQWSVALIAVAFVVLVVYVIITLRHMSELMVKTSLTMESVEKQVALFADDAKEIMKNTRDITENVKEKLESLDAGFSSIRQTGEVANEFVSSIKKVSTAFQRTVDQSLNPHHVSDQSTIGGILQTIPVILNIWRNFRK